MDFLHSRFIGELFKLQMLVHNIMHDCVVSLLEVSDEESLECLCVLLTTIGKDMDTERAKVITGLVQNYLFLVHAISPTCELLLTPSILKP